MLKNRRRGGQVFEELDPREGITLSLLNTDGTLGELAHRYKIMSDELAKRAYEIMMLARQADEWGVSLNRQGRMGTYVPNRGQEANSRPSDRYRSRVLPLGLR